MALYFPQPCDLCGCTALDEAECAGQIGPLEMAECKACGDCFCSFECRDLHSCVGA